MSVGTAKERPSLKVMISGGGTGGHIFPAIAIANAIKNRERGVEFLFVGAEGKMEMEKVPAAGYRIEALPIRGFQRHNMWKNLTLPIRIIRSLLKARELVRTFKPDVAVGVGGYASGPTLYMAGRSGVPTVIQEQNSFPGVTNKLLAKRASKVCVAYDGMEKFFPAEKIIRTGNPVRKYVVDIEGKRERALAHFGLEGDRPILFVTGGSLGARSINHGVRAALTSFRAAGVQVVWQTGKPFCEQALQAVHELGCNDVHVHAFIKEMDLAYAAADLVLARAGAMSISELCLVRKPAILVPLPTAAEDHQTKNARALTDRNAAVLVADTDAVDRIGPEVLRLIQDKAALDRIVQHISGMGVYDADDAIAAEVIRCAKE
jgi:UDP-N-acetylglucosamine--N-acetylmuramyl-(pentapeptide) pyrophosphoryl-undecaprenol N-acetylglucosamine transferase